MDFEIYAVGSSMEAVRVVRVIVGFDKVLLEFDVAYRSFEILFNHVASKGTSTYTRF